MQLHEKSLMVLQITPQKYVGQGDWVGFVCLRRAGRRKQRAGERKVSGLLAFKSANTSAGQLLVWLQAARGR